jgi:hypothetical protein
MAAARRTWRGLTFPLLRKLRAQDPTVELILCQTQQAFIDSKYSEIFDPGVIRITVPAVGAEADPAGSVN